MKKTFKEILAFLVDCFLLQGNTFEMLLGIWVWVVILVEILIYVNFK